MTCNPYIYYFLLMRSGKFKTVIFDFDGTIADSMDVVFEIFNTDLAGAFKCKTIDRHELELFRSRPPLEILARNGISPFRLSFLVLRARAELKKKIDQIHSIPGIETVLKNLKDEGVKIGICTSNSRANVTSFLLRNNLSNLFDFIYSGKHFFGKDRILRRIIREQSIDADTTLFVGDEVRDIEAGHATGIKVASVTWGFNERGLLEKGMPDFLIEEPVQLLSL